MSILENLLPLAIEGVQMDILDSLNQPQRQAATHIDGAMLILAGAGSGKTKTITTRLAYLIKEVGIPPSHTLTLTFSNKAAKEMKERALKLLRTDFSESKQGAQLAQNQALDSEPLLCTFHRFCLIFLRKHIDEIGRKRTFNIIDGDDRKSIIKKFIKKNSDVKYKNASFYISDNKNNCLTPATALTHARTIQQKQLHQIYEQYEQYLQSQNMLDFDDLLVLSVQILQQNEELARKYSQRYQYIMVDEYQDTNALQLKLLKLLTTAHQNIVAVGDDDQSIYGWRGADIKNILTFDKQFENVKIVKLEQNYRSTPQILNAANNLIAHNKKRHDKRLFTQAKDGEQVQILNFGNSYEESREIARLICKFQNLGIFDIAILFRINALSRGIEQALIEAKIPYKLIGTINFYEREEIKDAMSYLRLLSNANDDFSLFRMINKPKRGFGKVTQDKLEQFSLFNNMGIYDSLAQNFDEINALIKAKNVQILKSFFENLDALRLRLKSVDSESDIEARREKINDFLQYFDDEFMKKIEYENNVTDKRDNIKELFGYLGEWLENGGALEDFLADISLNVIQDESAKSAQNAVSCMSIHSAKGLEFECVFVIGFENGIFPIHADRGDENFDDGDFGNEIEEERRLGYVALTRAKSRLFLSHCDYRAYRKNEYLTPSIFLREIGDLGDCADSGGDFERNFERGADCEKSLDSEKELILQKNDSVSHKIFGLGVVREVAKTRDGLKVRVSFGGMERVLLAKFLQKV